VIEAEVYLDSVNREEDFSLSRYWKLLIQTLKE
jgi:hypothetical protein